jgi:large subunit ribosomal protein L30e
MAENTTKQESIKEIKKLIKTDKLVIGTEEVVKALKAGSIEKIYLCSNCPDSIKERIGHYAALTSIQVATIDMPNDELGIICKKMFSISVLGIKR